MGQTNSITVYPFHEVDRRIRTTTQFQNDQWESLVRNGMIKYFVNHQPSIYAAIALKEWPINQEKSPFHLGCHYYRLGYHENIYHYDADHDQWINQRQPNEMETFVEAWHQLIMAAIDITDQ